jgi:hypothetical protein
MENKNFFICHTDNSMNELEQKIINTIISINQMNNNSIYDKKCLQEIKENCELQLKQINLMKQIHNCNHEYITDTIDINPEKSQTITYCVFCESTI